jgi:di/tricarboxylate transporter
VTLEISIVLAILLAAVTSFVTGWLRMDVTALLVLALLALAGVLSPAEAFAGFSSPAVITVGGMFVISAALARTGVANLLGRHMLRVAGERELPLVMAIMLTAGVLSSVMNNIGVAAMLLPVVMDIARRTGRSPSRLLMPLALGSLMGGLTTLIGTPPNLLVSEALREHGLPPFRLLDFTGPGGLILLSGVAFVGLVGVRLLPQRDPRGHSVRRSDADLVKTFNLQERIFALRIPPRSPLAGRMLAESRLGSALGLHVLALMRVGETSLAPAPDTVLQAGDRLVVQGRPDLLLELRNRRHLLVDDAAHAGSYLVSDDIGLAESVIDAESDLVGSTLLQLNFRHRFGVIVLALERDGNVRRTQLERIPLQAGDVLLLQGPHQRLAAHAESDSLPGLRPIAADAAIGRFHLNERLITLRVTGRSLLVGRSLADTRIGDAAGLTVIAIVRGDRTSLLPDPDEVFRPDDVLVIKAHPADLAVLRGLQRLEVEEGAPPLEALESEGVGLMEVVLAPRTTLVGKAPREVGFREKYGLSVVAIWRGDRAWRSNLRDMPLRFGDALLLFGPREKLKLLAREPDFLVLSEAVQDPPLRHKAPVSVAVLVAMLLPVLAGVIPIAVAVVVGAVAMVLTRCLQPEEAYRAVEWQAIILIAGMLPLGTALERTGAAQLLSTMVLEATGDLGPRGILAGLCILTALGAQMIPAAAVVVLMAPIALTAAADYGLSPYALLMGIALSAASLSSPVAHPANVLIMGPGGYRYTDYLRLGIPLTVMVLVIVVLLVPLFFPLTG